MTQNSRHSCDRETGMTSRDYVTASAIGVVLFLAVGFQVSFSVYFTELTRYFLVSARQVSCIAALQFGLPMMISPLSSAVMHNLGARPLICTGGYMMSMALIITAFSDYFSILFFSHGIMAGIAFGLIIPPSLQYLEVNYRQRKPFNLVVISSGALGGVIVPIACKFLIRVYQWDASLLVISATLLNICACSLLLKKPMGRVASTVTTTNLTQSEYVSGSSGDSANSVSNSGGRATPPTSSDASRSVNDMSSVVRNPSGKVRTVYPFTNDLALVKTKPCYVMHLLIYFLLGLSLYVPVVHLNHRALASGQDELWATFLVPAISVGTLVSRVALYFFSHNFSSYTIAAVAVAMAAVTNCLTPMGDTLAFLFAYALIHGFAKCCVTDTFDGRSVRIVEAVGSSFGLTLCRPLAGVGQSIGIVLAGNVFDTTGDYDVAFYAAGAILTVAFLLVLSTPLLYQCLEEDNEGSRKTANTLFLEVV
ncbi:monocarboxylate transporter 13-like [Ptychodera flava]|uniref:monocarboxylate transporter 13-like n=1 Tax=Ptychodera flava TaxID=63121 RepID=UPI00396A5B11